MDPFGLGIIRAPSGAILRKVSSNIRAPPWPHWSQFSPRLMLLDLAVLPHRGLFGSGTIADMGFVENFVGTGILRER